MSQRAFWTACLCVFVYVRWVIVSVFNTVCVTLQTAFTHMWCELLFSLMTHSIHLFFLLFHTSQNILIPPRVDSAFVCVHFESLHVSGVSVLLRAYVATRYSHHYWLFFLCTYQWCAQHLVCNFSESCAFQNALSILFFSRRDEAVYYYSPEVISDAMCPHGKNNNPNMPPITHAHCSNLCCLPLGNGHRSDSLHFSDTRLQSLL